METMNIRMSAGATKMRLVVEETPTPGQYYVKDVFTTLNGSWEAVGSEYDVPGWARDAYLRPLGAPDYFDDAGGAQHLFARVLDEEGNALSCDILFWSEQRDGKPYLPVLRSTGDKKSLWANIPIYSSFSPERGERGAWRFAPVGTAQIVAGASLPNNLHVSTFVVWQKWAPPITDPVEPTQPLDPAPALQEVYVTQPGTILRAHGSVPYRIEVLNG